MKAIQYRGQFFVEELFFSDDPEPIPVDNFVFYTFRLRDRKRDGLEVRLSGVGDRCVVSFGRKKKKSEWFDTYAQGLRRMADILDGTVKYRDFGSTK